jgi:hypothetical protein
MAGDLILADNLMKNWRLAIVRGRGTDAINQALGEGRITLNAAVRASRYLSKPEQDAALAAAESKVAFSRTMAQVALEHQGRTIRVDLSEEEWSAISERRRRRGGNNGNET